MGLVLGFRQIQQSNIWASVLIVTVVVFTLLNLVVISGILNGIIEGVIKSVREEAVGDIVINPLPGKSYISETEKILNELSTYDQIEGFTPRYEGMAIVEANYKDRRDTSIDRDVIAVNIQGVDPEKEMKALSLASLVTEGEYFDKKDRGYIVIGKYNIDRYGEEYGDVFDSLKNVYPGDTVRVFPVGSTEGIEFIVKGIIHSKIDVVALSIFIPELDFRRMFNRVDYNANKIIIRLKSESEIYHVQSMLIGAGFGKLGEIEIFQDNIPKFIKDVTTTFERLSLVIGSIGIFVASITVFIIIFINVISRRRQIGILKAIGIRRRVIEYAYATQAGFYALTGILIGLVIIFYILIPYFMMHPIDFPYTFVFLNVTPLGLFYQCLVLFVIMVLAGFVPAWIISRQHTLNSILGRK